MRRIAASSVEPQKQKDPAAECDAVPRRLPRGRGTFEDYQRLGLRSPRDKAPVEDAPTDADNSVAAEILTWTRAPITETSCDGGVLFQVNVSASPAQRTRDRRHRLVRTTRLEPVIAAASSRPPSLSRPSSKASSRPSSASRPPTGCLKDGCEEIRVTEADFRRCRQKLSLLRQCQLQAPEAKDDSSEVGLRQKADEDPAQSFKTAFLKRCRSSEPPNDPWRHIGNPEAMREGDEKDLILNQVWVDCSSPIKAPPEEGARSRSESTRASSNDSGSYIRRGSKSSVTPSSAPRSRGRRPNHASGCPKGPNSARRSPSSQPVYESRIKVMSDEEAPPEDHKELVGSALVKEATRLQQRFQRQLEENPENSQIYALWLSLDPLSGEAAAYRRAVATRLESAYSNNRSNVPLAGLGGGLDDDIVILAAKGSGERLTHKCWKGGQKDICRLEVPSTSEVCVNVVWDHAWKFADAPIPGTTEERRVALLGSELVSPPSPPVPRSNPAMMSSYVRPLQVYE